MDAPAGEPDTPPGGGDTPPAGEAGGTPGTPPAGEAGGGSSASRSTDITAGPGGVMTDEVGVVTGELTLRTELHGDQLVLRVQYKDADEWYVVTGGRTTLADPAGLDAVHTIAVGLLDRPDG